MHIKCDGLFCEIHELSANDGFVYQYVPEHYSHIYMTNVLMEHLDQSVLENVPSFVDVLHISNSHAIKSISLPMALRCIVISSTSLRRIDIAPNSVLIQLFVSFCDLVRLPRSISQAHSLQQLEIRRCKLRKLDFAIVCENSLLFMLNLKGNRIRYIVNSSTKYCGVYDSLTWLLLSENRLFMVNMTLFPRFVRLQYLHLDSNRIRSVAVRFVHNALLKLNMNNNRLRNLDLCRWHLPLLSQLRIERNSLELLPKCVGSFSNLSTLSLASNKLSNFTVESVADLHKLVMLSLSHNQLTTIMLNTAHFPAKLKTIAIKGNNLTELDLSLIPVQSLIVDAADNKISTFDVGSTSPNVTKLFMQHNPIDCSWNSPVEREQVQCKTVSIRTV